jgi:predicted alpha/beta hydrolase family esterase
METTSTPAFLIMHGWQNNRPEGHWQYRLATALTDRGIAVAYPQLPDPDTPDLGEWLARLDAELKAQQAAATGELVVVAHSLSASLWLHAAARGGIRADRVLLVAPPSDEVLRGFPEVAAFAGAAPTATQMAAAAGTTRLVAGDDDPYCPGGAAEVFGRPLGLDVDVVPGGAHLDMDAGYGSWQAVLDWCLDARVRLTARTP